MHAVANDMPERLQIVDDLDDLRRRHGIQRPHKCLVRDSALLALSQMTLRRHEVMDGLPPPR